MSDNATKRSTLMLCTLSLLMLLFLTKNINAQMTGSITCGNVCPLVGYVNFPLDTYEGNPTSQLYEVPIYLDNVTGGASASLTLNVQGVPTPTQSCAWVFYGGSKPCSDTFASASKTFCAGGPCGLQIVTAWMDPVQSPSSYTNIVQVAQNPSITYDEAGAQNLQDCSKVNSQNPHSWGGGASGDECQNYFDLDPQSGDGHGVMSCSYSGATSGIGYTSCTYTGYNTTTSINPGTYGILCEYVDFPIAGSNNYFAGEAPLACVVVNSPDYAANGQPSGLGASLPVPPNYTNNGFGLQIYQSPSVVYPGQAVNFWLGGFKNGANCNLGGNSCPWLFLWMGSFAPGGSADPSSGFAACNGYGATGTGTGGDPWTVQASQTHPPGQGGSCSSSTGGSINGVTYVNGQTGYNQGCELGLDQSNQGFVSASYTVSSSTPPGNYLLCGYASVEDARGFSSVPYWVTANFVVCDPNNPASCPQTTPYCGVCQGAAGIPSGATQACLNVIPGGGYQCLAVQSGSTSCPSGTTLCNINLPPPGTCGSTSCLPSPTCLVGITCYYGVNPSNVSLNQVTAALCNVYTIINSVLFILALVVMLIGGTLYAGSHVLPGSARGPLQGYGMGMILGGVVAAIIATAAGPILSIVANVSVSNILMACP